MSIRDPEAAEMLPSREPISPWAWLRRHGIRSGCLCCVCGLRVGRRRTGHGKHRTLRDHRRTR